MSGLEVMRKKLFTEERLIRVCVCILENRDATEVLRQ